MNGEAIQQFLLGSVSAFSKSRERNSHSNSGSTRSSVTPFQSQSRSPGSSVKRKRKANEDTLQRGRTVRFSLQSLENNLHVRNNTIDTERSEELKSITSTERRFINDLAAQMPDFKSDNRSRMHKIFERDKSARFVEDTRLPILDDSDDDCSPDHREPELKKSGPYTWDFCLVFRRQGKTNVKNSYLSPITSILYRLHTAGLETRLYHEDDNLYALVGITEENLKTWAEHMESDLLLDAENAIKFARDERGLPLARRTAMLEREKNDDLPVSAKEWENIHILYKNLESLNPSVYKHYPRDEDLAMQLAMWNPQNIVIPNTPFNTVERLRMIHSAMVENSNMVVGGKFFGAQLIVDQLIQDPKHPLLAAFPLHQKHIIQWFDRFWLPGSQSSKSTFQIVDSTPIVSIIFHFFRDTFKIPVNKIRRYFGERIAFYFDYLKFMFIWLCFPAVLGIGLFAIQLYMGKLDVPGVEYFQFLLWLWSLFFTNYWKQHEQTLIVMYGMHNHEQKEVKRPDFVGHWDISKIDGEPRYHDYFSVRLAKRIVSLMVLVVMIVSIVVITAVNFRFKDVWNKKHPDNTNINYFIGVVTAIQKVIFQALFNMAAVKLNLWENHVTQESYENSMILKSFAFSFFNSFFSLFWVGFLNPLIYHQDYINKNGEILEPHSDEFNERIFAELQIQLSTLYITSFFIDNFVEIFLPKILQAFKSSEKIGTHEVVSAEKRQFMRDPYEEIIDDMTEIMVHYGYATLFFFVFPLTPVIAFLSIMVEARIDGYKLLHSFRRPIPLGSCGIGLWSNVLDVIVQLCLFTNVYFFIYRTGRLHHLQSSTKFNYFVCTCFILEAILIAIYFSVPTKTKRIQKHLKRQQVIEESIIWQHTEKNVQLRNETMDVRQLTNRQKDRTLTVRQLTTRHTVRTGYDDKPLPSTDILQSRFAHIPQKAETQRTTRGLGISGSVLWSDIGKSEIRDDVSVESWTGITPARYIEDFKEKSKAISTV